MSGRKDVIPLDPDWPANLMEVACLPLSDYQTQKMRNEHLHFHDCLELDFVLSGKGVCQIEETVYPLMPGDICIINSLEHHMAFSKESLVLLVLVFDASMITGNAAFESGYLQPFYDRNQRFVNRIAPEDRLQPSIKTLLTAMRTEWAAREPGWQLIVKALLLQLLGVLYRHFTELSAIGEAQERFQRSFDRIRPAVQFIHTHLDEPLPLQLLAQTVHMNRSWFSTSFHQVMGVTLTRYIEQVRMEYARSMLTTSICSITEIAGASGFPNLSFFNRRFKALFGMSPGAWRKSHQTLVSPDTH